MTTLDESVQAVRHFSRFYTAHIGTLEEGLLKTRSPWPKPGCCTKLRRPIGHSFRIAARLRLDPGYVSRLLSRFEQQGLIRRRTSASDARQNMISLTAAAEGNLPRSISGRRSSRRDARAAG